MKWAKDSRNKGARLDYIVIYLSDDKRYYYHCTISDKVVVSDDEWFKARAGLRREGISLEWEHDAGGAGEKWLIDNGYEKI